MLRLPQRKCKSKFNCKSKINFDISKVEFNFSLQKIKKKNKKVLTVEEYKCIIYESAGNDLQMRTLKTEQERIKHNVN